jgi:hypothetical protein
MKVTPIIPKKEKHTLHYKKLPNGNYSIKGNNGEYTKKELEEAIDIFKNQFDADIINDDKDEPLKS